VGWLVLFFVNGLSSGFDAAISGPEAFQAHPLRYLVEAVLSLMLTPVMLVLLQTPFIAAYKALSEPA
jgi:hypothetical protein